MGSRCFLLSMFIILMFLAGCAESGEDDSTCDSCEDDDDDDNDDSAGECIEGEIQCGPSDEPQLCTNGQWTSLEPCGFMQYCNFGDCIDTHLDMPADESPHRDLVEWWYWTGHMTDDQDNLYGFELTFFYGGSIVLIPAWMIHVAIIDESANLHTHDVFFEFLWPERYPAPFRLESGSVSAERVSPILYTLNGAAGDYAFSLSLTDLKGVVHHGGNGTIRMTTHTTDSFYYSRPRMALTGTLTKSGTPLLVTGEAWMDHQWGNWMPLGMVGWDWFSLRLDDGTEVMYFIFRGDRQDQSVIDNALGSYVDENSDLVILSQDEVTVTPLGWWESEKTGGKYPQNWRMEVPGLDMDVTMTTNTPDQEMPNPIWNYWEGLVHIEGTKQGHPVGGMGYVELSGYSGRTFVWW